MPDHFFDKTLPFLLGALLIGAALFLLLRDEAGRVPASVAPDTLYTPARLPTVPEAAPLRPLPPAAFPSRLVQQAFAGPIRLRDVRPPAALEPLPEARPPTTYTPEKAGFAVKVKDEVNPYRVFAVFIIPGEQLDIEAVFLQRPGDVRFVGEGGTVRPLKPNRWTWTAPKKPGLYPIHITDTAADETITLNAFVLVPFDPRQPSLNGYRIGHYRLKPLRGNPLYNPPRGFVEVTEDNRDARVSPHFTLGQFLCKQAGDFPKYLILRERLVLKLEMVLEAVNEMGISANTLHVMSGFRTPYYNQSIGNETSYSRHLYGDAADVFVDTDGDGTMDDLDGDGRVTTTDAKRMADLIERKAKETWYQPFVGGMGIYSPAPHRGPFVHVDVRGQRVRW